MNLNCRPVDLDPTSADIGATVDLVAGTNVKTVSVPLGSRGMHELEAFFVPDGPGEDGIDRNNRASAMTFVAGPGHVLIVDPAGSAGAQIARALADADIDARQIQAEDFPQSITKLIGADAIILVNTDNSLFTYQQQEMLRKYVEDLGEILNRTTAGHDPQAQPVVNGEQIVAAQQLVRGVAIAPHVQDFAIRLVLATQPDGEFAVEMTNQFVRFGGSPRGVQAVVLAAKVRAMLDKRYHISFDDLKTFFLPAVRHRVILNFEGHIMA